MKAIIFALAFTTLDCAAFGAEMRTHFIENLMAYNRTQAAEAAQVWQHDGQQYQALLDALTVKK